MSVLSCSRKRCDNIMCRTYVPSVGYVCRECQTEFKGYLVSEKIFVESDGGVNRALKNFMNTDKGEFDNRVLVNIDDFFQEYTKDF